MDRATGKGIYRFAADWVITTPDWYVSGRDTAVSVRGVGMGQRQVDETVLSVEPVERR